MSFNKGFAWLPILLVILGVLAVSGGAYWYEHQNLAQQTQKNTNTISVPGMSQYTDSDFGFSFWYPSGWTVKKSVVQQSNIFPDAEIKKELVISSVRSDGSLYDQIFIQEVYSSTFSLTDIAARQSSPIEIKYFFNLANSTWMHADFDPGSGNVISASTTADISNATMGNVPVFPGAEVYAGDLILPLTKNNLLVVYSGNLGIDQSYLAKTIVAADPPIAMPVSVSQQEAIIQAEKDSYSNQ